MIILKENKSLKDINIFFNKYDIYYDIFNVEKKIGYGAISLNSDNMIFVYIKEEYRGNYFGSKAFDRMLEELLKHGINKVNLMIETNNICMKRIINHKKTILKFKNPNFEMYECNI